MVKSIILWVLFLVPALAIELFCFLTAPLVAFCVTKEKRKDRVKRLKNKVVEMNHEYIIKPLRWWQTHDNAVDEYWWGMFNTDSMFKFLRGATQEDYDNNYWIRYTCRLFWMWRNCAYGFHYALFSRPNEPEDKTYTHGVKEKTFWYQLDARKSSFQLQLMLPILPGRYMSFNIGWKEHKGFPKVFYANRIIGPIRKFKG